MYSRLTDRAHAAWQRSGPSTGQQSRRSRDKVLERLNAEIKQRTNVVGTFPNDHAITRLVGAMLPQRSDEWARQRRYMQLEACRLCAILPPLACLLCSDE